jgi:hypothetical protein
MDKIISRAIFPLTTPALGAQRRPARSSLPRPHFVFLIICSVNAILLTVVTPPFQVHDEFQHFFRSYQISEMHLWGTAHDGRGGGMLPSSLPEFVENTWGTLRIYYVPPLGSHPLAETWKEFQRPLDPDRRKFADFSGVVSYAPLPYIPQAIAMALGRHLGVAPLGLLYLGRLANAFAAIAMIFWSLKLLPTGREAALVIASFPMAQFEYASVAPDAAIIATSFLFTSIALGATVRQRWSWRDVLCCIASGSVFCSIKPVYAPLLTIGLPAAFMLERRTTGGQARRRILIIHAIIIGAVMLVTVAWFLSTWNTRTVDLSGNSMRQQVSFILRQPLGYAAVLAADIVEHARHYVADTIGIFGVWKVYLPPYVYVSAMLALFAAAAFSVTDNARLPVPVCIWYCALIIAVYLLIQSALYVMLPIGDFTGLQGRYLLPLGALSAALLSSAVGSRAPRSGAGLVYVLVIGALCCITAVMGNTIASAYQVF